MKLNTKDNKEDFCIIDILKFLMAICVVAIHTNPAKDYMGTFSFKTYSSFVYLAAPFFFAASGYLLASKTDKVMDLDKIVDKQIKKMISQYILWNIIYLPLAIYDYIRNSNILILDILDYVRGFLFVGEHFNSWILWYLLSSIYALIFIKVCIRFKIKIEEIVLIGIFIGILAILLTLYANGQIVIHENLKLIIRLLQKIFINGRIFTGFIYIPLGMLLYKYKHINICCGIMCVVIGFYCELASKGGDFGVGFLYEIGRVLCIIGIFLIISKIYLKSKPMYNVIRKMSIIIYFVHLWIWTIICMVIYGQLSYGIIPFILTTLSSIMCAFFYLYITKNLYKLQK